MLRVRAIPSVAEAEGKKLCRQGREKKKRQQHFVYANEEVKKKHVFSPSHLGLVDPPLPRFLSVPRECLSAPGAGTGHASETKWQEEEEEEREE